MYHWHWRLWQLGTSVVIACMLANKRDHIRKQITTTRTGIYVTLLLQLTYEFLMATKRKSDFHLIPKSEEVEAGACTNFQEDAFLRVRVWQVRVILKRKPLPNLRPQILDVVRYQNNQDTRRG